MLGRMSAKGLLRSTGARALLGLLAGALLLEGGCRALGLADVPLRSANPVTGYIPLPSQRGRFLTNEWRINELSMITAAPYDRLRRNVVLAGDSVVFGGNPLDQSERVGERLSELLGEQVYAIADGSWGFKNQLAYFMSRRAELGDPRDIVFVLNSEDFGAPSAWRCFSHHPTTRPLSAAYFVLRKYTAPECEAEVPAGVRVADVPVGPSVAQLLAAYPRTRVTLLLYPKKQELLEQRSIRAELTTWFAPFADRVRVLDLVELARTQPDSWRPDLYADTVHPTSEGASALARVIAERVLGAL